MGKKKDNMLSIHLVKKGDKLVHKLNSTNKTYSDFVKGLEEGQLVEAFFDANVDDGTLAQLAKIYKCIRELAREVGEEFEDMKIQIKKSAGLCIRKTVDGEDFLICKSLGDCSKVELGLVIDAIIKKGEFVGINFH
jgi:hypothetical protein